MNAIYRVRFRLAIDPLPMEFPDWETAEAWAMATYAHEYRTGEMVIEGEYIQCED